MLLACDPGKSTGLCVFDTNPFEIIKVDTVKFEDWEKWDKVFGLDYEGLVVEQYIIFPGSENKNLLVTLWAPQVIGFLRYKARRKKWRFLPPSVKNNLTIPRGIANSEHAKDAIKLAMYHERFPKWDT